MLSLSELKIEALENVIGSFEDERGMTLRQRYDYQRDIAHWFGMSMQTRTLWFFGATMWQDYELIKNYYKYEFKQYRIFDRIENLWLPPEDIETRIKHLNQIINQLKQKQNGNSKI